MYRIALLEADHWHVNGHLKAIAKFAQVKIVAISGNGDQTRRIGAEYQIPVYVDYRQLLDEVQLDFVYVFGIYRDSPAILTACIERGIPFLADKPCCAYADQLVPVLALLQANPVKHVVALQRRKAQIVDKYRDLALKAAADGGLQLVLRYITATPERYVKMQCPWANIKACSGGGALVNLGIHYIDLVTYLTNDEIVDVGAVINNRIFPNNVDDYASLVVKTKRGNTAVVEVGYTNPGFPEEHFVMGSRDFYITGLSGQNMKKFVPGGEPEITDFPDINYFDACLDSMIRQLTSDEPPIATLSDAYRAMTVVQKAYDLNPGT